ncbi:hypothetical protein KW782_01065 [Candidatus Parcubacteria bacterium]|nr:hypothetical protein [Candidatus Parcubacteria bacterium]
MNAIVDFGESLPEEFRRKVFSGRTTDEIKENVVKHVDNLKQKGIDLKLPYDDQVTYIAHSPAKVSAV